MGVENWHELSVDELRAGDFHQLPPVAKGKGAAAARKFAFEADSWRRCHLHCAQLTHVFRQVTLCRKQRKKQTLCHRLGTSAVLIIMGFCLPYLWFLT